MKIAIVILNWNGEKFLEQFLPILIDKTQIPDVEIIVADNASTDGSMKLLAESFKSIRTILFNQNYGFAEGYNRALAQIDSEYYLLLNSDIEVGDNWLQPMLNYMDEHKEISACQPKIKSFADRQMFEHAGAAGGFIDYLGFPFCRGRVFNKVEVDNGQYDSIVDVFWATGACLMIRSEIFNKVGGLDNAFFAHMEEIDLCWRLNSRGYRLVCIPESVVYHVGGGTLNAESPYKTYLNFRNNLLLLYKNLPQKSLENILIKRRFFDYLAAFQFFISGKTENAKSVLKARTDFIKMLPDFEEKRKENILYATKTNCNEMLKKSIVIEFFLKRKHTYNQLINDN